MALPTDVNPFVQFTSGESLAPSGDRGDAIAQSIKFRSGLPSGNYLLKKNFSSDGTAFTISYWVKKHNFAYIDHFGNVNTTDGQYGGGQIGRNFSDTGYIHNQRNVAAYSCNFDHLGYAMSSLTDQSGWNHYVWTRASGTASNRFNVYVNGVQRLSSPDSIPSGDPIWPIAGGDWNQIPGGNIASDLGGYWGDLYMAEWHYIDGTVYAPTTFGRFNDMGVWVPKTVTGVTYGTQGHYLKFDPTDSNGVAHDSSGQGNHWTKISMQENADWRVGRDIGIKDTPTNNISVLNRLQLNAYSDVTFSSGALTATAGATVEAYTVSHFPCRQKTYWETYIESVGGGVVGMINVEKYRDYTLGFAGGNSFGWNAPGNFYYLGSSNPSGSLSPSTWDTGDTLMHAYDPATGKYWTGKNGTWDNSGNPGTGANPTWTWPQAATRTLMSPGVSPYNATYSVNFGQYDFTYTVPTGFDGHKMDRGTNLTIKDPSQHFDVYTYTSAGTATNITFTGWAFQPDLVWIKSTSHNSSHNLFDSVRGVNKSIKSNNNSLEGSTVGSLTSFDSNGFSLGTADSDINYDSRSFVAWGWKAGETFTPSQTGGLSNLSGSRNTDAGFSIVKYNGNGGTLATVGHGLNEAPQVILVKRLTTAADNWLVYHASMGATYYAHLDTSAMPTTSAAYWNNTEPTDSVFTINSASGVNADDDYIAYCWHGIEGYSKMGMYGTGNGSSNGPYVYTGFKPRYVMIMRYNGGGGHWYIWDSERTKQNPRNVALFANDNTDNVSRSIAFLSTGFRITDGDADINANNDSYIYWAYAEKPVGGLNVAPMTGE